MNNFKHYLGYGLAVALLLLLGRFWLQEHDGKLRAEGEQKIIEARDAAQKELSAKFEQQIRDLKTPAQAAPVIERIFVPIQGQNNAPGAPITVPRAGLAPEAQKALPDAPTAKPDDPIMLLTPGQQVSLGKFGLGCEKVAGELSTCEQDKKGGTKWQKVVREAKCLGFLGAGAAVGAKVGGWKGAAIGGVSGEVGCKIFF